MMAAREFERSQYITGQADQWAFQSGGSLIPTCTQMYKAKYSNLSNFDHHLLLGVQTRKRIELISGGCVLVPF